MKLVKAYNSVSLVLRIVIGMVIGAALALLIPNAAVTAPGIGILGTLFVGALKLQYLARIELEDDRVVAEHRLLEDLGQRIRDVRQGPDGWLYVLTDSPSGQLIRMLQK